MSQQAGMLVLQLKIVNDQDLRFTKSIINGFQYKTDLNEDIIVLSQSATIINVKTSQGNNQELIISSGNYLFKYLNQQIGMSY